MVYRFLFTLVVLVASLMQAKQFIYPVGAQVKDGTTIVHLMHQKSLDDIELLAWNPITKVTTKELLSTFIPALFRILPHASGFSFIDKDRIRVKSFQRRSPKTIVFSDPVDEISSLEWIDENHFYFMARRGNRFCILQSNVQGDLKMLAQHDHADCMYPQKVGDLLFYVERAREGDDYQYRLMMAPYPPSPSSIDTQPMPPLDTPEEREIFLHNHELDAKPLIDQGQVQCLFTLDKPIAFLHMMCESRGFFVTYPSTIQRNDPLIPFTYYEIFTPGAQGEKVEQGYAVRELFTFTLPAHFFVTPNEFRLYESLLPFLPKLYDATLYFTDCFDAERLRVGLFAYDLQTGTSIKISHEPETFGDTAFAPIKVGSNIFYGGILPDDGTTSSTPAMWINDDGLLCVDLGVSSN